MLVISASNLMVTDLYTVWKASKYGVISGPNAEKYGPEKTLYLLNSVLGDPKWWRGYNMPWICEDDKM